MRTHFFLHHFFLEMNHRFGVAVVDTGDDFSTTHIFITIFVNNINSKFKISNFVLKKIWNLKISVFFFKYQKTKQDISNSYS